ncbi:unnamed protein product [Chironomus riparius]|uniref:Inturned planar cell polarity effector homolog n=1 Tax=Chironomus riparius TaxID=315576 RepID=A0A9N9WNV2_9DIPT|nr:unnamed protein product [Chironomus riparius]
MSNASDCSSYSYSPDFKNYIYEDGGSSLFYIRAHSLKDNDYNKNSLNHDQDEIFRHEFKRMSLRQRDKGILSKLTNKKSSGFEFKVVDRQKYRHTDGELKELKVGNKSLKTANLSKSKKGDKRSLFEILFNASIIPGPDNKRLIIDRINTPSIFEKDLCVGDYIKTIDGEVITTDNINHVLHKIIIQKSFKIVAQESYKDDYDASQEEIKITKINDIVANKQKLFNLGSETHELIFSLNIIVKNEQITEDSDDFTTVFSYPPKDNNFLHKQKGSFLTLASILKGSFDKYPNVTSIKVHNTTFFVTYTIRNGDNEFIFLGFNSNYAGLFDSKHITQNFVKFLDYIYPNFIIINDFDQLNSLCEIVKIQLIRNPSEAINFEQLFSCPKFVPLPKEIVLRINDALSELEAMDYRNWNESLMELFGKFNVIGSCLFYKTSLICSHFNELDMENVELFVRQLCLKFLYEMCYVKEMAIWQRVYPKEYQSYNIENDSTKNKVFLLIAARANLMMCVLLEENAYNLNPEVETQSSNYLIYFLEEMEDVMDHLKVVGIENLTKIWINSAKRPQCKSPFDKIENPAHTEHQHLRQIKEECEDDDESEKDLESHIDSQKSSSGFENEDTFYKDFADIVPQTLTFGPENVLYHFTQLDFSEGIILTTINDNACKPPNDILVDIFRRSCLSIHCVLQNTIQFNQLLSRENKISSKTMMLPKEQGMLIDLIVGKQRLSFWIIGRLFGTKELYVCYDSKIPQNMVEIAFRIALNCIG